MTWAIRKFSFSFPFILFVGRFTLAEKKTGPVGPYHAWRNSIGLNPYVVSIVPRFQVQGS